MAQFYAQHADERCELASVAVAVQGAEAARPWRDRAGATWSCRRCGNGLTSRGVGLAVASPARRSLQQVMLALRFGGQRLAGGAHDPQLLTEAHDPASGRQFSLVQDWQTLRPLGLVGSTV